MSGESAQSCSDDKTQPAPELDMVQDGDVETNTRPVVNVGYQLRVAREAKGLTINDVVRSIKLSARQVEALEADNWPSLPGKTMIRGFVRNYARLLELDADVLMVALDSLDMPVAPELRISSGTPVSMPREGGLDRRDFVRVVIGLVVLVLAILAFLFVPQELWQSTLSAMKTATLSSQMPTAKNVVPEKVEELSAQSEVTSPMTDVPPEATIPSAVQPVPATVSSVNSLTSLGNGLKFSFAKPSWVEVRDRSGQIVFSQLNQAGSQREIDGQPPFTLVVGNAANVTLQYKGKTVDLSRRSRDDVARLTLE